MQTINEIIPANTENPQSRLVSFVLPDSSAPNAIPKKVTELNEIPKNILNLSHLDIENKTSSELFNPSSSSPTPSSVETLQIEVPPACGLEGSESLLNDKEYNRISSNLNELRLLILNYDKFPELRSDKAIKYAFTHMRFMIEDLHKRRQILPSVREIMIKRGELR